MLKLRMHYTLFFIMFNIWLLLDQEETLMVS